MRHSFREYSTRALAVSLAALMLLSMVGMTFVGGAAAQAGGTYNDVITNVDNVGNDVAISTNDQVKTVGDASLNADGSVDVPATSDQFDGVAVTPERINELFDVSEDPTEDNLASFLDASVSDLDVSVDNGGDATGAIFIEFAPQSEFSQIESDLNEYGVSGTHDYIVVTQNSQASDLIGNDYNGSDDSEIVAVSVNNDDESDHTILANGGADGYGAVFDTLVGSSEADLQDKNVDEVLVAAGTFSGTGSTITDFSATVGDDTRTVHTEQVALEPGDGSQEQYFTSVETAIGDASSGDTIRVTGGTYDDNGNTNDGPITVDVSQLTITGEPNDLVDPAEDPTFGVDTDVTAANVTVEGVTIENSASPALSVTGDDPTVNTSTINADGDAIDVEDGVTGTVTIENNDLNAADPDDQQSGDTGLNLTGGDTAAVSGNAFDGFQTQIANGIDANATALRDDNTFAQLAVPVNETGAVVSDSGDLYGSIQAAENDGGAAGNTVEVSNATYNEDLTVNTTDVVIRGVDGQPTITGSVNLNSADAVTFENFALTGDGNTITTDAGSAAVTIDNVDLPGERLDITNAGSLTIRDVDGVETSADASPGVDVNTATDGLVIDDVNVTILDGHVGVQVDQEVGNATITNVDASGPGGDTSPTGIEFTSLDMAANNPSYEYTISDNELTNLGDGVGIDVSSNDSGNPGTNGVITLSGNTIEGNSTLTGVEYDLPDAEDVTITDNIVTGADVTGADASIGFEFEAITGLGTDPFVGSGGDAIPFQNNTVTNHARLIQETDITDPVISAAGYNAILDSANNNEFGTLVIGPNDLYNETYGTVDTGDDGGSSSAYAGDANSYLPGSVNEATNLVLANENLDEAVLEVKEPTVESYVDNDVSFNGADNSFGATNITIQGETEDVTVATTFTVDSSTDTLNNHVVRDLTVDAGEDTALTVDSTNAQVAFQNLDVTAATGLDANADNTDVNVVEVSDSQFDVADAGLVLGDSADDRDGFVIEDTTVTGPGIDQDTTGLDLSSVDKPGKEGLPVNLSVTNVTVQNFTEQVALSSELANIDGVNASAVEEDTAISTPSVNLAFTDNSFEHAVLVFNDDSTLASEQTLYGSIDEAEADAADTGDTVEVRGTAQYAEDVDVGADNITLSGPQAGDPATDNFRDAADRSEEARIVGQVTLNDNTTVNGFTIIGPDGLDSEDAVVATASEDPTNSSVTVNNTAITSFNADEDLQRGVEATDDTDVVVTNSFVGSHAEAGTVNQGIVTDGGTLTVTDSQIIGGDDLQPAPGTPTTPTAGVIVADGSADIVRTTIADYSTEGSVLAGAPDRFVAPNGAPDSVTLTNATIESGNLNVIEADSVTVEESSTVDNSRLQLFTVNGDVSVSNSTVTGAPGSSPDTQGAIQLGDVGSATIERTSVVNSDVAGLLVEDATSADSVTLTANTFENNTYAAINNEDDEELDATLNYYGTNGPEGGDSAGIEGDVTYDPFLTEDKTDTASDVSTTTDFAHDVIVPADTPTSVGFPAQMDTTIGEAFNADEFDGSIYAFDADTESFTSISDSSAVDFDDSVSAFDAYVAYSEDASETVRIEYDSDNPNTEIATYEFQEGLNFVSPAQAGQVDDVLFPGGDTDLVQMPFEAGDNLYGTGGQTDANFSTDFVDAGFAQNFRGDSAASPNYYAGDNYVHPHTGYLVIVNEEGNAGLTVSERITKPAPVTADTVEDRTNATAVEPSG